MRLNPMFATCSRRWRVLGCLAAILIVSTAVLIPAPALAANTWHVDVGAQTSDAAVQANVFRQQKITVDVGDIITWNWRTDEIHSVTFLSRTPRPPLFSVVGTNLIPNGMAFGPSGDPTVIANYSGAGYVNSGVLAQPASFSLKFTATGDFGYVCLVHSEMTGTVHVNAAGARYPSTQASYDLQSRIQSAQLLGQGRGLAGLGRGEAALAGRTQVTLGIGERLPGLGSLAVLRFLPEQKTVRVGQTVTWTNRDFETPHTVTFGPEPANPPFGAFAPSGTDGANHATVSLPTQPVNSGFIGADFGSTSFSVTFTKAGTYSYICVLHDDNGMIGTIIVTP
jgi:plastocyanin